jgi:hypothetical protein
MQPRNFFNMARPSSLKTGCRDPLEAVKQI